MKVLLVHNAYRSHLRGGEDAVFEREFKDLQANLGHEQVFRYSACNDDVKLWALPFTLWGHRKHAKKIYQLCMRHQIDVVHVHNFFPVLTPSVFIAAKKAGCKVVHTLHNYRWWCLNGTLFYKNRHCHSCVSKRLPLPGMLRGCYRGSRIQSLLAGLAFWWYKRAKVRNAIDCYFVLSHHQETLLSAWLPHDKMRLKPNAIDLPVLNEGPRQGYVFVGRLEPGKGIEPLLEAWQQLGQEYPLTVIGSGELEHHLTKRYRAPHIKFLGSQPFDKVAKILSSAKFCLYTSLYYETFGLVLLEAMARGTPVIGFPIGTRNDFIHHGVNGYLCAPDALVKLIKQVHEDPNYPLMSQRARQTAEHYSHHAVINNHIHHYEQLLEKS